MDMQMDERGAHGQTILGGVAASFESPGINRANRATVGSG
jgi:hypothetical protein